MIPVFSDDPRVPGRITPCSQTVLAKAIRTALAERADIINISAGELVRVPAAAPELAAAIRTCEERGVLVVAAAGNDGCDCAHVPALLPGVLVVGSANAAGLPSAFSNYSSAYRGRGLAAPGEDIPGASPGNGGIESRSGTSSAAPLVSGLAALLMSAWLKLRGAHSMDPESRRRVRAVIFASVAPCQLQDRKLCSRLLTGRVQPLRAYQIMLQGDLNVKDRYPEREIAQALAPASLHAGEGLAPSCAGNPACSCGCGTQPGNQEPSSDAEEELEDQAEAVSASVAKAYNPKSIAPPHRVGTASTTSGGAAASTVRACAPPLRPGQQSNPRGAVLSSCDNGNCGGGGIAYALGEIGYDFGTQARFDAVSAEMDEGSSPNNPRQLLEFLQRSGNAHFAASILWTLNHDLTPVYAIRPEGPYARETYQRLVSFFQDQINEKAQRASMPGIIDGTVMLQSGQSVPVLLPELRGMYNWSTADLVRAVIPEDAEDMARSESEVGIRNFLERVYYDVRNMGQLPEERALNFAATNAFNIQRVFEDALKRSLQLDEIGVERSPVCRPDSDCWDVRLVFFNPEDVLGSARQVYRFTVDVSDIVPVLVGPVRTWAIR